MLFNFTPPLTHRHTHSNIPYKKSCKHSRRNSYWPSSSRNNILLQSVICEWLFYEHTAAQLNMCWRFTKCQQKTVYFCSSSSTLFLSDITCILVPHLPHRPPSLPSFICAHVLWGILASSASVIMVWYVFLIRLLMTGGDCAEIRN